ncbi:MAG: hypothetical protein Aureis2KO_25520 [Aureisphaera sp.]
MVVIGIAALIIILFFIVFQKLLGRIKLDKCKNNLLEKEVANKNKDLKNFALEISQKREWAIELLDKIKALQNTTGKKQQEALDHLRNEIQYRIKIDESSELFYEKVESLGSSFYGNLREKHPNLTKTDIRLCALIRMNLDTKQIAMLQNINPSSVKMSRNRLRKKLNLDTGIHLDNFLSSF